MVYILLLIGVAWISSALVPALVLCQAAKRGDAWIEEQNAVHMQPLTGTPRTILAPDVTSSNMAATYPSLYAHHQHGRVVLAVDMPENG